MSKKKYNKSRFIYDEYADKDHQYHYYHVKYKGIDGGRYKSFEEAYKALGTLIQQEKNGEISDLQYLDMTFLKAIDIIKVYFKNETKRQTCSKRIQMIKDYIVPNVPDKPLRDLTKIDFTNFRNYIGGLDLSSSYKNELLGLFKQVLKYAKDNYDVPIISSNHLKKFPMTDKEKIEAIEKTDRVWSPKEFEQFIGYVRKDVYRTFFTLAIVGWAREGELLALKWKDYNGSEINVYQSCAKINKRLNPKGFEISYVKTDKSGREIMLPEGICQMLDDLKAWQQKFPGFCEDWFIFSRLDGGKYKDGTIPLSRTNIDRVRRKAIAQSGVRYIRLHDLRHSGTTHAIMNHEDIKAVSERLGHSTVDQTLKTYHHAVTKSKKKLMKRSGDYAKFPKFPK